MSRTLSAFALCRVAAAVTVSFGTELTVWSVVLDRADALDTDQHPEHRCEDNAHLLVGLRRRVLIRLDEEVLGIALTELPGERRVPIAL